MAGELSREEVIALVDRILRGVVDGDEAEQWLALAERSLGLARGRLLGPVYYPEQLGLDEDATAEDIVAAAERED